jgi:hypothetical protein
MDDDGKGQSAFPSCKGCRSDYFLTQGKHLVSFFRFKLENGEGVADGDFGTVGAGSARLKTRPKVQIFTAVATDPFPGEFYSQMYFLQQSYVFIGQ